MRNRYGIEYFLISDGKDSLFLLFENPPMYWRMGGSDDTRDYEFIDPEGGPFIAIGDYAPVSSKHPDYKRRIVSIRFDETREMYELVLEPRN